MKENPPGQNFPEQESQDQENNLRTQSQTEKNKGLSRRDALKIAGTTLIGYSLYQIGRRLGIQPRELIKPGTEMLWPQQELSSLKEKNIQKTSTSEESTPQPQSTSTPLSTPKPLPEKKLQAEASPTPTPEKEPENPFSFLGIDFSTPDQPVSMLINPTNEDQILVPAFHPHSWNPKLPETIFLPKENTSIAWLDQKGRIGLWLHSGRLSALHSGFTMWNTQKYIEETEHGYRRTPQQVAQLLSEQIVGAQVDLRQEDNYAQARITAAVRIPPHKVIESKKHVIDIVPWLAENFPDTGFEKIKHRQQVLLPKFCGRHLAGESKNPKLKDWTQARFVFALEKA